MAALQYMQLFPADYLADTPHLTLAEHGAYLLLIMNYWQRGEPLRDSDKKLAAICRTTLDDWMNVRPALEEFFTINEGHWVHKRIENELEMVRRQQQQRVAAGKASAKSRLFKKD